MEELYTLEALCQLHQSGKKLKYLFFWGHQPSASGAVTSACFSQWWQSGFEVGQDRYATAEHWMMAQKARLFGDEAIAGKILLATSPGEAKKLGRQVKNFNQETWEAHRSAIVEEGNLHKFQQAPDLKEFLLSTQSRILVEASPVDPIWGIGMAADHEFAKVPTKWRGLNLLGFALMKVRDQLSA